MSIAPINLFNQFGKLSSACIAFSMLRGRECVPVVEDDYLRYALRWKVYPMYIELRSPEDYLVSKTYMTRVEG